MLLIADLLKKMLNRDRNIIAPIPQWRQGDGDVMTFKR